MAAVEAMVDAEHVHRAALTLGDTCRAPGQFGHDDLGIDPVGEHVTVVAISSDHAVFADSHRRLQSDGNCLLTNVQVTKSAIRPSPYSCPARSSKRRMSSIER